MAWSKMVDMELDDEDKLDFMPPIPMPSKPDYPFGLRISLTHVELKKLGLDHDCAKGDRCEFRIECEVTDDPFCTDHGDDHTCRVELQIVKMAVADENS
jgi:hypothetical protein